MTIPEKYEEASKKGDAKKIPSRNSIPEMGDGIDQDGAEV